jgi:selenide,water dikinase
VDDPHAFGRVAAANALSDIYAMGAAPLFALNIVGFPAQKLGLDVLGQILRGGAETAHAAGIDIVGGHSIDDPEPKYGLVVTGRVRRDAVWTNAGARPGDVLVLTKPLASGIFTTALKRDLLGATREAHIVELMATLNRDAAAAVQSVTRPHACTDVTGFGLIGHLHGMLRASGVGAELDAARVPYVAEVLDLAAADCVPGGTRANHRYFSDHVDFGATSAAEQWVLCDAQTSGGLLVAVAAADADAVVAALAAVTTPAHAIIGRVVASAGGDAGRIVVRGRLGGGAVRWR